MTHRGPFQPRPFCDSVIYRLLKDEGARRAASHQFLCLAPKEAGGAALSTGGSTPASRASARSSRCRHGNISAAAGPHPCPTPRCAAPRRLGSAGSHDAAPV